MCISAWASSVNALMASEETMGGMLDGFADWSILVIWVRLRSFE